MPAVKRWTGLGLYGALALVYLLVVLRPAFSFEYPVSIPSECVDLANRNGEPVQLQNRRQALRANWKLSRLSRNEPGVTECRAAVARIEREMKQ